MKKKQSKMKFINKCTKTIEKTSSEKKLTFKITNPTFKDVYSFVPCRKVEAPPPPPSLPSSPSVLSTPNFKHSKHQSLQT